MIFARTDDELSSIRDFSEHLDLYGVNYAYDFCRNGTVEWYIDADDLCCDDEKDYPYLYEWEWVETDEDTEEYVNYLEYVRGL